MISPKSCITLVCSVLAVILFMVGISLMIGGSGSIDAEVRYRQSIGVYITLMGTVVTVGIMIYYIFCHKKVTDEFEVV